MIQLDDSVIEKLKQDPITKRALKETGLTFDQIMKFELTLSEDPLDIGASLLSWTGTLANEHIASVVDFAILRWYYSPESHLPEFERWSRAASMYLHAAMLGTYADDGSRIQRGRKTAAAKTNEAAQANARQNIDDTRRRWEKLAKEGRPEHERAGIIATQTGKKVDTVREWIRKAGLR